MSIKGRKTDRHSLPVPSFVGLRPASEAASRAKRANRKRDTKPEILLRRALWAAGLRYRKYVSGVQGNPDIVFSRARVVVFCDGDFWHGRNWAKLKHELGHRHNSSYWCAKISRNIARDKRTTAELERLGWAVVRLWETDTLKRPKATATELREMIRRRLSGRRRVWARQRYAARRLFCRFGTFALRTPRLRA